MAGEALGQIGCKGCGGTADIKKLKNSELLYLHCKKCGMDRRTGEHLQSEWRAAISGIIPQAMPEQETPPALEKSTAVQEWQPSRETHKNPAQENSETIPEQSGLSVGKKIGVAAVFLLSIAGMIYRGERG